VLETTDFHAHSGRRARPARDRRLGGAGAYLTRLTSTTPKARCWWTAATASRARWISNLQFGRPVVEQMNALGYAATAVGNHEFDWGQDTLARRVHSMKFAALAAT